MKMHLPLIKPPTDHVEYWMAASAAVAISFLVSMGVFL